MKFLLAVVLCVITVNFSSAQDRFLEDQLRMFLRLWQTGQLHKLSLPFPLPLVEQVTLPSLKGEYGSWYSPNKLSYSTSDTNVTGLNNLTIQKLNALPTGGGLGVNLTVQIPVLKLFAECYAINGKFYWVRHVQGTGKMRIELQDVGVEVKILLVTNGNGTKVENLVLRLEVERVKADLENLEKGAWLIEKLNSEGAEMIMADHDNLVTATQDLLIPHIHELLREITPVRLVNAIKTMPKV